MANELVELVGEAAGQVLMSQITVSADEPQELTGEFTPGQEFPLIQVHMPVTGKVAYEHFFLIDKALAGLIYSWMVGGEVPEELNEEHYDAVKEAVGQIAGQLQAAMADDEGAFTPGDILVSEIDAAESLALPEGGLAATYKFKKSDSEYQVTHAVQGELTEEAADAAGDDAAAEEGAGEQSAGEEGAAELVPDSEDDLVPEGDDELLADDGSEDDFGLEDFGGEGDDIPDEAGMDMDNLFGDEDDSSSMASEPSIQASPADFGEFGKTTPVNGDIGKIGMILDVELDVSVELGRKIMLVDEILRLGKGAVIELNKLAGEPVDILVNGKKLAEGEVVVIEDHFGVRLTHLVDAKERIKSLGR
jgi:flagellar motor switch protein FliN/FliY